jgi:Lon protease-like protein
VPELGLFPLGLVLVPTERVPLHIFEPRYKELIGECLGEQREFGLVLDDENGLREIGTRASVIEVLQRFPDGRLNIVIEGGERFRVVELTSGRSFQTAEVEPVVDAVGEAADPSDVARAVAVFRALGELAGAEVDEPDVTSGVLSFELAARVALDAEAKQRLLEERSESARLREVIELLERGIASATLQRQLQQRAAGNGQVAPLRPDLG